MHKTVTVNYPAPIPVGHAVEVTEYADKHCHVSLDDNGGNSFRPKNYSLRPRAGLQVSATWAGVVAACSIVMIDGLQGQHTTLALDTQTL